MQEIETQFNTRSFSDEIEKLVRDKKMEYIDAVVHFCQTNTLDIETAAQFIKNNSKLKAHIQLEAEDLHYLPKSSKLPI
jgi:predicted CopG family antitoxin